MKLILIIIYTNTLQISNVFKFEKISLYSLKKNECVKENHANLLNKKWFLIPSKMYSVAIIYVLYIYIHVYIIYNIDLIEIIVLIFINYNKVKICVNYLTSSHHSVLLLFTHI